MSTSKWRNSSLHAFAVTILHRSRTAPKLRRYPAGSSCGSGGLGMATLGIGPGEKGVSGVPGPPPVLVVPADVRFMMRALVLMGVMMLEEPDVREDFDCELESVGCGLAAAFGARSLLENKPMSAVVVRGCRPAAGGLQVAASGFDSGTQRCARDSVGQKQDRLMRAAIGYLTGRGPEQWV